MNQDPYMQIQYVLKIHIRSTQSLVETHPYVIPNLHDWLSSVKHKISWFGMPLGWVYDNSTIFGVNYPINTTTDLLFCGVFVKCTRSVVVLSVAVINFNKWPRKSSYMHNYRGKMLSFFGILKATDLEMLMTDKVAYDNLGLRSPHSDWLPSGIFASHLHKV